LTLEITTDNAGKEPLRCLTGFHPYFLVGERDRCRVEGVDGFSFEDDSSVLKPEKGIWRGSVPLTAAIDRIFALSGRVNPTFTLHDPVSSRVIEVGCGGATHVNIWNPGAEKRCPGKIPGDSWRRFACVEPITIGNDSDPAVMIPPGGRRTLKMTVTVKEKK
jgi:D-hexose-6-phosphate mutarotase